MLRTRFASRAVALLGLVLGPALACADSGAPAAPGVGIAIADFAYVDTSGEPTDQTAAHQRRLQAFMAALRRDFAADGQFRLVAVSCGSVPCSTDGLAPADLRRAASQAGAKILVIGGIHKLSTLVQWAKVEAIDIDAGRVVFDRLFTFRGDNDEAWARAETFVSRDIRAALAAPPVRVAAASEPIKLALFDFELDDFSAGASSPGATPADTEQLALATDKVRQLLAQSGRYSLVDVVSADAAAAKEHTLRDCNGCDAAVALKLGAEQSFVGVVKRISRTEYIVRFQIRDARTAAVVAEGNSGLRLGANDSWSRGAARLIKDRLLASPPQQ